jgi:hypothetical protein
MQNFPLAFGMNYKYEHHTTRSKNTLRYTTEPLWVHIPKTATQSVRQTNRHIAVLSMTILRPTDKTDNPMAYAQPQLELQDTHHSTAMCFMCRDSSMNKGYQLGLCTSLLSWLSGWLL